MCTCTDLLHLVALKMAELSDCCLEESPSPRYEPAPAYWPHPFARIGVHSGIDKYGFPYPWCSIGLYVQETDDHSETYKSKCINYRYHPKMIALLVCSVCNLHYKPVHQICCVCTLHKKSNHLVTCVCTVHHKPVHLVTFSTLHYKPGQYLFSSPNKC